MAMGNPHSRPHAGRFREAPAHRWLSRLDDCIMGLAPAALRRVPLDERTGNLDQSFDRRWNGTRCCESRWAAWLSAIRLLAVSARVMLTNWSALLLRAIVSSVFEPVGSAQFWSAHTEGLYSPADPWRSCSTWPRRTGHIPR